MCNYTYRAPAHWLLYDSMLPSSPTHSRLQVRAHLIGSS